MSSANKINLADSSVPASSLLKYPHLRGVSLLFVLLGIMMHTIDSTIANVALPHIQGSLSANVEQIAWVITAYIVASAMATPTVAWLAGRFGIKRIMLLSVALFTLSSILCGLAVTFNDLVLYRILQGLSGAALIPIGQNIVIGAFKPEDSGKAMAIFGLGVMLGPILGPTLGGYITEWSNWRWVFFVNLPVGLLAIVGISIFLKERPMQHKLYFDSLGFFSLIISMGSFQLMMDRGHTEGWFDSWEIIVWGFVSVTSLYIFCARTYLAKEPFFDRRLFLDRNFCIGNLIFFYIGGNMVVAMLMIPVIMQSLLNYPADLAGLMLAPRGFGMMLAMALTPRLAANKDPRIIICIGMIITAVAMWDQGQMGTYFSPEDFARAGFIHGLGLGMIFVLLGVLSFNHMHDNLQLQASTFFNTVRNVGQSFCAALAVSFLANGIQINTAELGQNIHAGSDSLSFMTPHLGGDTQTTLALLQMAVAEQASFISYINIFNALAWISLAFAPIVFLAKDPRTLSRPTD